LEEIYTDFLVIGSGPAGQKAAIQAAKLGKSVIVVEKGEYLGGESLNFGAIPSKSLREAILQLTDFYRKNYYASELKPLEISINDLNYSLFNTLSHQRKMLERQFEKNRIRIIRGSASFENPYQIKIVDNLSITSHMISSEKILIATGSVPRNPENIPFDRERIFDSTRLIDIPKLPKTMIVLGGGIIGAEYASFFAALGVEVTLVDQREYILPRLDREIGSHLTQALTGLGLKFVLNTEFKFVERLGDGVRVECADGKVLEAEMLLYALGRKSNVDFLNIENAGINLSDKGYIPVNSIFQSIVPHIYAAGDVIGGPSLASTSMEQGRLVARNAFGAKSHHFPDKYPIGIYTIPEISCCGFTEEELQQLGYQYEVGRAYYYEIAKAEISGVDQGLFKILFHKETLEILGIQIIGSGATEVIHIGQVAMTFNARIDYFIDQVFNYPTFAEGYRIAALNGINKIKRDF
jgi:NAD(P) transhydrogenase